MQRGQTIPSISKEKRSLNPLLFPASPLQKIGVDNTRLRKEEASTILSSTSSSSKMHSAKTNEKSGTSTCLVTGKLRFFAAFIRTKSEILTHSLLKSCISRSRV